MDKIEAGADLVGAITSLSVITIPLTARRLSLAMIQPESKVVWAVVKRPKI